ncbi:MAG: MFS transporter [Cocleimonas sp.]|nr:MFS transporter [Cocleimonas sp.]
MPTTPSPQRYLYQRLSTFYFFFFAALGVFVPYWPLYLKSLNFSSVEIGELMAIVMASKILAPYLLGWLSDYLQKRLIIIQVSLLFTVAAFAALLTYQSYWWFVIVMTVFGFFWNASLPLFEALTLDHLAGNTSRYSHIRLWGSIGFIISVAALPLIIDENGIALLPLLMLSLLIANGISSLLVKDKVESVLQVERVSIFDVLKKPMVIALLLACALQSLSHGAYYTFFSIYLEDHGYSRSMTGLMWALGVLAEVMLFIVVYRLFHRFSTYRLFAFALLVTSLRWVILALMVDSFAFLVLSQLLHAASFGLFHAAAISLTHQLFPGRLHARGQALYAGISFGLGGAVGNLLSGYTWDSMGSTWTFLASALIALLGAIIAAKFVTKDRLPVYAKP